MSAADFLYGKNDHERVSSLLKVQQFYMAIVGQLPNVLDAHFPPAIRNIGRLLMRFYSIFVISQTLLTGVLFVKTTLDKLQHGELEEITDALTQAIILIFACFSTCYWLWHAKALSDFITLLNHKYWHHSLPGITYVSFYSAYAKARRLTILWISIGLSGAIIWGLAPLLQGMRTLPLQCWYPFDPLVEKKRILRDSYKRNFLFYYFIQNKATPDLSVNLHASNVYPI